MNFLKKLRIFSRDEIVISSKIFEKIVFTKFRVSSNSSEFKFLLLNGVEMLVEKLFVIRK